MFVITNKSNFPKVSSIPPETNFPFLDYQPDWKRMEEFAKKYSFAKKIILVGNGGSINTFRGIYKAFSDGHTPQVIFVDSNDPEFLEEVRGGIDPAKTLLLSISKSGENVQQLESTLFFYNLAHKIFVTSKKGVLWEIARADGSIDVIEHPEISGRFSGLTEVGLLPSLLCGFNARKIAVQNSLNQAAWQMASELWELENDGKTEVLLSGYAYKLNGFNLLIQQLMHETLAKEGKGLTIIPVESPESQHHTSQRLFGGRKNIAAVFVKSKSKTSTLSVPEKFFSIRFKDKTLADFNSVDLARSFEAEYHGAKSRADELFIPNVTLEINEVSPESVGEYIRFWQLVAAYSAGLRNLNPFDQPDVEASKIISFKHRFTKTDG